MNGWNDDRARRGAAFAVACSALVTTLLIGTWVQRGAVDIDMVSRGAGVLTTQAVGLLILLRRPGHRIGWIACGLGWLLGLQGVLSTYVATASTPGKIHTLLLWLDGRTFLLLWGGIIALLLHFPDGRLPSARWRWVRRAAGVAIVSGIVTTALMPGPLRDDLAASPLNPANPTAVRPEVWERLQILDVLGLPLLAAALLGSAISLIVRYRSGDPEQRAQIRWFVAAAVVFVAVLMTNVVVRNAEPDLLWIADAATGLAFALLPLSVGAAILRRRLYDIDRIISRTLAWGAVSAVVVGVYTTGVAALSAVTAGAGESSVAVAASTLAAAAVFGPARRGIQAAVDRRFNRSRYDAMRVVDSYREHVRGAVDPVAISGELTAAVTMALQPRAVAVWVRWDAA